MTQRAQTAPAFTQDPTLASVGECSQQAIVATGAVVRYSAPMAKNSDAGLDSIRERYPPILTTAQVAELLGLNVRTVMVMANDGRLPASRLPGSRKYHFVLEDVLATLARHRIVQTQPAKAPAKATAGGTSKAKAASPKAQPAKTTKAARARGSGR